MRKFNTSDIIDHILGKMRATRAPKKSLRVVHHAKTTCHSLGLEGLDRAYDVKLAGGHRLKLGVIGSEVEREKLLRICKEREEFIPLIVDDGTVDEITLWDTLLMLFRNAIKYIKRQLKKNLDIRPKHRQYIRAAC